MPCNPPQIKEAFQPPTPNKVVAKIASKWQKPSGLTAISGRELHHYLAQLPVEHVWGIGHQTTALLHKYGVKTALHFARQPEAWIKKILLKTLLSDLAGAQRRVCLRVGHRRA